VVGSEKGEKKRSVTHTKRGGNRGNRLPPEKVGRGFGTIRQKTENKGTFGLEKEEKTVNQQRLGTPGKIVGRSKKKNQEPGRRDGHNKRAGVITH